MNDLFRFLFKYSPVVYERGAFGFLAPWPVWMLVTLVGVLAAALALHYRYTRRLLSWRGWLLWGLRSLLFSLILFLLWHPSLTVPTRVPQQNVLGILLDDSASMEIREGGVSRRERVQRVFGLQQRLLQSLQEKFQVRTFRFSEGAARIPDASALTGQGSKTDLVASLRQAGQEMQNLPVAALILVSDGGDNVHERWESLAAELKTKGIPVSTVGVGEERFPRDVEILDVHTPRRVLAESRVAAAVTVRGRGFGGEPVQLQVREGSTLVETQEVSFEKGEEARTVALHFSTKNKGVRAFTFEIQPRQDETVTENNAQTRVLHVVDHPVRILYVEGEPRWEFKFILRSLREDSLVQLVSLLRTSDHKFYRQGIENETTLASGFPTTAADLFSYEGVLLGNVEASFFSQAQQQMLIDFVNRRGGGLMMLGGQRALAGGGYGSTPLADLFPVQLEGAGSDHQVGVARAELTAHGWDLPVLHLASDPAENRKLWQGLPPLADSHRVETPKLGATIFATANQPTGKPVLLASQRFGRGKTVLFSTSTSWRWQMGLDHSNQSHEVFWRQLLRWLVADTPGPVSISTDKVLYQDEDKVVLRAEVFDREFQPLNDVSVTASVTSPDGTRQPVSLDWTVQEDGAFRGALRAQQEGIYLIEVVARRDQEEIGRGQAYFQRQDGRREFFQAEQNRPFLEKLAEATGGKYYPLDRARDLADDIVYSTAGISVPEVRDLWDLPLFFFLALILLCGEWILRRRWGLI